MLLEAERFAARADVRGLQRLRQQLRDRDHELGGRRRDYIAGMLATIDAHLDAAHRLRLAHDQWLLAESRMRAYQRDATPYIQALSDVRSNLDDIKVLAGPSPERLHPLSRQIDRSARRLALLDPPPQLVAVHGALRSAYTLAANAVQLRRDAVEAADVELARQASAAASGALMLIDRARAELRTALEPPLGLRVAARP
jgi:hypothetical protein